jgi:hypothetical protein
VRSFAALQDAMSKGGSADLVYFVFDLLHLDGLDLTMRPNRLMLSGFCASRPLAMGHWRRTMAVTSRDGIERQKQLDLYDLNQRGLSAY